MPLPKYALQYDKCTDDELRQFVQQRIIPADRVAHLEILKRLDKNDHFRFLDLFPEIRNRVYELVLYHNNDKKMIEYFNLDRSISGYTPAQPSKAHPALLRTCRQIHDEARSILYDQSVYFADVYMRGFARDKDDTDDVFLFHLITHDPFEYRQIIRGTCPSHLLALRHVTLACALDYEWHPGRYGYPSSCKFAVQALVESFGPGNALKSLRIVSRGLRPEELQGTKDPSEWMAELQKLSKTTRIEFVGFPEYVEERVRKMWGMGDGTFPPAVWLASHK